MIVADPSVATLLGFAGVLLAVTDVPTFTVIGSIVLAGRSNAIRFDVPCGAFVRCSWQPTQLVVSLGITGRVDAEGGGYLIEKLAKRGVAHRAGFRPGDRIRVQPSGRESAIDRMQLPLPGSWTQVVPASSERNTP